MNYYNNNPLMQQIFGGAPTTSNSSQMSEKQFFSVASTLNKQALQKLVAQARKKGISEEDIREGLNILLQHR